MGNLVSFTSFKSIISKDYEDVCLPHESIPINESHIIDIVNSPTSKENMSEPHTESKNIVKYIDKKNICVICEVNKSDSYVCHWCANKWCH